MRCKKLLFSACLVAMAAGLALSDIAAASGGIDEFSGPIEKVMNTLTGPVGRYTSIVAMGLCGVAYIWRREEMTEGFKHALSVVFGISFIAFATSIVDSIFSFSGVLI